MRGRVANIFDVMEYGPIVFSDEDYGVLITVNGAYFNWWNSNGKGGWVCVECMASSFGSETSSSGLYAMDSSTQFLTIQNRAQEWFERVLAESREEEEDEEISQVVEDFS